jgi:predicted P-loop ATPase
MVKWREYEDNERGPGGGYGVPTGSRNGFFVVDVDVKEAAEGRPGEDGLTTLEGLAKAAGGEIPDTTVVATPTGGFHFYFSLPPDTVIRNSVRKLGPGIDVRGEGGFVVGPGSPHRNGGAYATVSEADVAAAPEWLLEAVLTATPEVASAPAASTRTYVPLESHEGARRAKLLRDILGKESPAISGAGGSGRMFGVARRVVRLELPIEAAADLVEEVYNPRCDPPWTRKEIIKKLSDADRIDTEPRGLASEGFFPRLAGNAPEPTEQKNPPNAKHEYTFRPGDRPSVELAGISVGELTADLFAHVEWDGVLAYDEFKDQIVATNPPLRLDAEHGGGLSDKDVDAIRCWLEYHGKKARSQDVFSAIQAAAYRRKFHAVQDYLNGLKWDGVKRLDTVLPTYFNTKDTAYERAIGPRWFISLVARALLPGCQSDCTLTLQGKQGFRKNEALRCLAPNASWYSETSVPIGTKDFYENIRGIWMFCWDELHGFGSADRRKMKSVMSSKADRYRKSYGRIAETILRQCGFCATTNDDQPFDDPTGNRRFWPVIVEKLIDINPLIRDRDQLWAEAVARFKAGEAWYVDSEELRMICEGEQDARVAGDSWEEVVAAWLAGPKVSLTPVVAKSGPSGMFDVQVYDASKGVTVRDALVHAIGLSVDRIDRSAETRMGNALKKIGWSKVTRPEENGARVRRYSKP